MKVVIEIDATDHFEVAEVMRRINYEINMVMEKGRSQNFWSNKRGEENRRVAKIEVING